MHRSLSLLTLVTGFFLLPAIAPAADGYAWKAAAAKVDITPREPVWLAGYAGRTGPSEGVIQPIHAKLLTIEDAGGTRLAIVTLDLIGVPRPLRDAVESMAREKHGIAPGNLLINASHTHSGPMMRNYRPPKGGGKELPGYLNVPEDQHALRVRQVNELHALLVKSLDDLLADNLSRLEPAKLVWSHSRCGFAMNRRTPGEPGNWRNFPNPDAPVDHEVPVLQVRSADGKDLKAVLFGYACHATVLGLMQISGDWPGFAQQYFEADHPGSVAMFLNGCSGDQNPYPRRLLHYAERHGRAMATAIEAALETDGHPLAGPLKASIAWPEIPYQAPPGREELEARKAGKDRYDAMHAGLLLDTLDTAGVLPKSYPVPVQVVRFGDGLNLVAIGGEVVVDYALRLKKELGALGGGAPVWVAGYSNDVMTYIPSRRVLEEGGYEGGGAMRYSMSIVHPAPWVPEIEDRLVGQAIELFRELGK